MSLFFYSLFLFALSSLLFSSARKIETVVMSVIFYSIETDLKCLTNDQRSITVATLDQNLMISLALCEKKHFAFFLLLLRIFLSCASETHCFCSRNKHRITMKMEYLHFFSFCLPVMMVLLLDLDTDKVN